MKIQYRDEYINPGSFNWINFIIFKEKMMDYSIKLKNNLVLKGLITSPGENMRAMILFVHGLGEHLQRYSEWADLLNKEGIGFTGVDLPGHGRSDGSRGNIKNFTITHEMIDILYESIRKTFPGVPVFIYGQSLGGGIVLDYLLKRDPKIKGAIVTSPWLKLAFKSDKFKVAMVCVIKSIFPALTLPSGLIVSHISSDKEEVDKYIADPLVHDRISAGLFHSAMSAAEHTLAHAAELNVPLLLMHGSDDMICSPEGSREFASLAGMAELKIWEGGYHELHNEFFKKDVFEYILNWINIRLK